jgi:hypothetical protein
VCPRDCYGVARDRTGICVDEDCDHGETILEEGVLRGTGEADALGQTGKGGCTSATARTTLRFQTEIVGTRVQTTDVPTESRP